MIGSTGVQLECCAKNPVPEERSTTGCHVWSKLFPDWASHEMPHRNERTGCVKIATQRLWMLRERPIRCAWHAQSMAVSDEPANLGPL